MRTWTIYLDQEFLRSHMLWALPRPDQVLPGLHPAEWNGRALFFRPGPELFARMEPVLRQMSVVSHDAGADAAAKLMALFARAAELTVPVLVTDGVPPPRSSDGVGRLATAPVTSESRRAAELMREDMARPWRLGEVAAAVALSKSRVRGGSDAVVDRGAHH